MEKEQIMTKTGQWPDPGDIVPAESNIYKGSSTKPVPLGEWYGFDRMKRKKLHEAREQFEADLQRDVEIYNELRAKGNGAVSENDLRNGYDAKFNLRLKSNHISVNKARLKAVAEAIGPSLF